MPRIGTPESYAARSESREIAFAQACDERGEMADAGQYDRFRGGDLLRLDGALGLRAELAQRALDRRQIPRAVIDDCDFHSISCRSSRPLVDGSTRRNWRSRVTAKRSAFANALKIDST